MPQGLARRDSSDAVGAYTGSEASLSTRGRCLAACAGGKPLYTPKTVPLDLLFFRRVFSNLHQMHGNSSGEVPLSVFQRAMVRLLRVLGMEESNFDAEEYDTDNSEAVGWYEFVSCWKRSQANVTLSMAERIFLAVEDPGTCFFGQLANVIVTILIAVSCVLFILGTMPSLRDAPPCDGCEPQQLEIFDVLEGICIGVFTFEYLVRFCTAPFTRTELLDYEAILRAITEDEPVSFTSPLVRCVRFVIQPMNIIDVVVIVPFYVELMAGTVASNFTVLRVLRLTRLFRLVKLGKYFEVLEIIVRVFRRSTKMLYVMGVYLLLGICFSSAAMYYVESGSWDRATRGYVRISHDGEETPTPFVSIPHAFWWCIVTFTTVGYGDVFPVTVLGKLVASCTMIFGILVLAMPISVISMNFTDVWTGWNEERRLEAEAREQDMLSVSEALEGLQSRSHLLIELWDERLGGEAAELLGEVECRSLPIESMKPMSQELRLPLRANGRKPASFKASGWIQASFSWQPSTAHTVEDTGEDILRGRLEVKVQQAEGLPRSDWKKAGMRDCYAVVHCWPRPPEGRGTNTSERYRTATVHGSCCPVWEELVTFDFNWPSDWRPPPDRTKGRSKTRMSMSTQEKSGERRQQTAGTGDSWTRQQKAYTGDQPSWTSLNSGATSGVDDLRETVETQGREIRNLAGQVAEIKDLLCEIRAEFFADRAGKSPRLARLGVPPAPRRPPSSPSVPGDPREPTTKPPIVPSINVPGFAEADY